MTQQISEDLLKILVCPICKSELGYSKEKSTLQCTKCKNIYEIKDDIPILLND